VIDYSTAGTPILLRPHWQIETIKCTIGCVLGIQYILTEQKYTEAHRKRQQRNQSFALPFLPRFDEVLQDPDIVEVDPQWADEQTLLYFRRFEGLVDNTNNSYWLVVVTQSGPPGFVWTIYPAAKGELKTWQGQHGKILYRR
jgi:hypothetical protein